MFVLDSWMFWPFTPRIAAVGRELNGRKNRLSGPNFQAAPRRFVRAVEATVELGPVAD